MPDDTPLTETCTPAMTTKPPRRWTRAAALARQLWPVGLPLLAGLLVGGYCFVTTPDGPLDLQCHWFKLASCALVRQTDRWSLIAAALLLALWLVFVFTHRCKGAVRAILRFVLSLGVLGLAAWLLLPHDVWPRLWKWCDENDVPFWAAQALLALLVMGAIYWFRRRRLGPKQAPSRRRPALERAGASVLRWASGAALSLWLLLHVLAGFFWGQAVVTARRQPDVILVMVCTLRADHLGCYGYDLPTTPNIDRFARHATRFAQAVSPSSWTLWSTSSILTARYPEWIFRKWDYHPEDPVYPGLPSALSDAGYATALVSDHQFLQNDSLFPYSRNFDAYVSLGEDFPDKLAPQVTERALRCAARRPHRRLFLWTLYADPHEPYLGHREFHFGPSRKDALGPAWTASLAHPVSAAELANRQDRLNRYNSEIAYTDQAIGALFAGLQRLGRYDNALIIVCGDHGEEFLEHGSYGHQMTLYREVTSVPLLVKYPGQTAGRVVDGRFPLIDLYPSIMKMLALDDSRLNLQGEGADLSTLLRCTDKPVYGATVNRSWSVLAGHYHYYQARKYARSAKDPYRKGSSIISDPPLDELYDLHADPREFRNGYPQPPDVAASLREVLEGHKALLGHIGGVTGASGAVSASEADKLRERLKSLGYLQE